jgi:hypothetical protein
LADAGEIPAASAKIDGVKLAEPGIDATPAATCDCMG